MVILAKFFPFSWFYLTAYISIMTTPQQLKKVASIIPKVGVIPQEFMAAITDIKPCFIIDLNEKQREIITREFSELTIRHREKTIIVNRQMVCGVSKEKKQRR